ncbi:glycosyltransferase [Daejeonella sp. JGW-45]|uniref:glycosyltransferase family 4 protein n=1 Tax=Daejeonella sp. JGW-45 TaxID=3034148 RepID=UPI0023EAEC18|nr:glycosyltransferase [Daejeonella sp. JGW-45]
MKSKKSFVTVFTDTENFHLVKDVGQIPYFMYRAGAYEAELVTYRNSPEYPYLKDEVKGLKLSFIENTGRVLYAEKGVLKFLRSAAKRIDVLNLFHFKKGNILYLLLYKILNPQGKAYVKLDIDLNFFRDYNSFFYSKFVLKNYLLKVLTQVHFRLTDLFSVETEEARNYLLGVYPELKQKLICVPNGVDSEYINSNISLKSFEQKENIIISVGRIGTAQKNTELFLESLLLTDLGNWSVYIAGNIEDSFKPFRESFFARHPRLKDKIFFTGEISDRKELYELYNRAKVFCMTSRFEGFPIAFAEASYFGNYIISTPVSSASYVTGNGRLGTVAEARPEAVSAAISKAISEGFLDADLHLEIKNFAGLNLTWQKIVRRIISYFDKHAKTAA